MEEFIYSNDIWLIPLVTIFLTIIFEIFTRPTYINLDHFELFNWGLNFIIASISVLLPYWENIDVLLWIIVILILIMMVFNFVQRFGWNRPTKKLNFLGILILDIIGIILFVFAVIFVRGVKK